MLIDTRNAEFNEVPGVGHYRLDYEAIGTRKNSGYIQPVKTLPASKTPTIKHKSSISQAGYDASESYSNKEGFDHTDQH